MHIRFIKPTLPVVALLIFGFSAAADAATLTATSIYPADYSNFSITFTDSNHNGLLDATEITGFSGFQSYRLGFSWSLLGAVPTVSGYTVGGATGQCSNTGFGGTWLFCSPSDTGNLWSYSPAYFTYRTSLSPVPLPAGGVLLLTGLSVIAGLKRHKRRKAAV